MLRNSGNFSRLHNLVVLITKTSCPNFANCQKKVTVILFFMNVFLIMMDDLAQLIEAAEENRRPFGTQLFPFRTIAMILSMITLVTVSKGMVSKMTMGWTLDNVRRFVLGLALQKWQTYKGAGLLQMHCQPRQRRFRGDEPFFIVSPFNSLNPSHPPPSNPITNCLISLLPNLLSVSMYDADK